MIEWIIYGLFLLIYYLLIRKSNKTYPLIYLFFFTYFLQYLFSTYLIYHVYDELRGQMEISSEAYFGYANLAIIFLFAGVLVANKDFEIASQLDRINPEAAKRFAYLLIGVSFSFDLLGFVVPILQSVLSFTHFLKYVAAFCFLFSNTRYRYIWIALLYIQLFMIGLQGGVFIGFFVWSTYLFFFIALKFRFSLWLRFFFIFIAAPILIVVQGIKEQYRHATWVEKKDANIDLFTELAIKENERNVDVSFFHTAGFISTVGRLSEGWHLGLTLKHVPKREPIANGQDMWEDVAASFIPRFLFQDKKEIGSQAKFLKYTGRKLHGNTSMTIGVLGDFYVNYGVWGSYVGLFIFGMVISICLRFFLFRYVRTDPINIIWVPYLFNYLLTANNDFYSVINCIIKGFLVFLFVKYLRTQLWPAPGPQVAIQ